MATSDGFIDHLKDALAPLGAISVRRMFGGAGIYCKGTIFALVDDDVLYLKADAANRPDFEAEGLGPFVYVGKGKPIAMSYWRAPERLLDDSEELIAWATKAVAASKVAKASKPARPASKTRRRVTAK